MNKTPDRPDGDWRDLRRMLDEGRVTPAQVEEVLDQQRAAEDMLARITARPPKGASARLARRPRSRPILIRIAVVAALVIAITGVLYFVHVGSGRPDVAAAKTPPLLNIADVKPGSIPGKGDPAGRALEALANEAAAQEPAGLGAVQHVRTVGWSSYADEAAGGQETGTRVLLPKRVDSFYFPDGRLRIIERTGDPLDQHGRVTDAIGSWTDNQPVTDENIHADDPPDYPESLPTDSTKALSRALLGEPDPCPGYTGGCLLAQVKYLHDTYVLQPQLQAALWRVLAAEPTITYLGRARDRLDREALVFTALEYGGDSQTLIFADPATGAWLGSETVLIKPDPDFDFDPPAVLEFSALVTSKRVSDDQAKEAR
ncbi:MAG: CU044_5270 family protein [Nocardioidaceae bacterium]